MDVQQTSIQAYIEIKPELGKRQEEVFNAIKYLAQPNNREIALYCQLPINCVTGRVKELREMGIVYQGGIKYDDITKRDTIWWDYERKHRLD